MNISTLITPEFVFFLLIWISVSGVAFRKARRSKRAQNQIVDALDREGLRDWHRIYISRTPFFRKWLKFTTYETRGILINLPDAIRLIAEWPSGERIDQIFPKSSMHLRWHGISGGIASSKLHWIAIGSTDSPLMLSADKGFNAMQSREATADLCRRINPDYLLPDIAKSEFALEKNPASLIIVTTFFLLLAFALIDGKFLNKYEWVRTTSNTWLLMPGMQIVMLLALPVYWWLSKSKVPPMESLTLSWLIAITLGFAYIPAIKRVDQLLSAEGPQSYAYRLGDDGFLTPVSDGPPNIDYKNRKEYWNQFEENSIHQFNLVHGPLGLWQLDHSELEKKMQQFYEQRRKSKH
ncbi:hypothetical protein [Undibacterium squillarum]|uniref:PH (Pleckstrin Homology) domain-containing protein n=1 Tax=Undibacterium squillarum TaxID=1131567 RepID=A0ABQ2XWY5_9BURK|nr:hypothetical protein [Undibacterium squillarum]GGX36851.1 hypothetical protein GCM10010946_13510 [Undibacterium squillarum]